MSGCSGTNVAIHPDFQRRGLGRRLLAHAEAMVPSLGLCRLRLFTNKLFVLNVRLYSSIGYRIHREETFEGDALVHMSKDV